jgi:hypothetical protein
MLALFLSDNFSESPPYRILRPVQRSSCWNQIADRWRSFLLCKERRIVWRHNLQKEWRPMYPMYAHFIFRNIPYLGHITRSQIEAAMFNFSVPRHFICLIFIYFPQYSAPKHPQSSGNTGFLYFCIAVYRSGLLARFSAFNFHFLFCFSFRSVYTLLEFVL